MDYFFLKHQGYFLLISLLFSASANAITVQYFATSTAATAACNAAMPYNGTTGADQCNNNLGGGSNANCSGGTYTFYGEYKENGVWTKPWKACANGLTPCVSPNVHDANGICNPPATVCPAAGTPLILAVKQTQNSSSDNGEMVLGITGDTGALQTAIYDSAAYLYSLDTGFAGDCYIVSGEHYCTYHSNASGECNIVTPANAALPGSGTAASHSDDGKCLTDSKNNTLCKTNPEGNLHCGTVNGSKICFDTTPGTGTVNGAAYQTSDKNCGFLNGKPVCVSDSGSSATTEGCLVNGGVKQCVNSDVNKTSSKTTVANPDGSTTTTEVQTDNIIGPASGDGTTTTTTASNGDTSTTSTGHGGGGFGGVGGSGGDPLADKTDCDKYPNSLGCQDVSQETEFKPDEVTAPASVDVSYTPVGGFSDSGSCPADYHIDVAGHSYLISFSMFCSFLSALRPLVLLFASLQAMRIIFGGDS